MFYNDLIDHIHHSEVIKYADDTVIFYADKDATKIENFLNGDMKSIGKYCIDNELIINTKKGKTEVMLFGSSKRLKTSGKKLRRSHTQDHQFTL